MKISGKLFAERAMLIAERRAKVNNIEKVLTDSENRELTPEEQAQLDDLKQSVANLTSRIEALENAMEIDQETESSEDVAAPRSMPSLATRRAPTHPKLSAVVAGEADRLLRSWFRLGTENEFVTDVQAVARAGGSAQVLNTRSGLVTNATTGSYAVAPSILSSFERLIKSYCRWLDVARVIRTNSGEELRIAVDADQYGANASAYVIDEAVADADKETVLEQRVLKSYGITSGIQRVSMELLQDSAIDLEQMLSETLATRIGRTLSELFTTGTGSGQPSGLLKSAGSTGGIQTSTAASSTAIALDDFVNAYSKLDPVHQAGASIMMSPQVFGIILKLKDSTAQPYFFDSATGATGTILGCPIVLNPHMDTTLASNKISVVVGNFKQFAIRQVGDVVLRRTNDRYWEFRQTAYSAYLRVDSCLLDPNAFVAIKH